jgi:hypothetical protein
MVEYELLEGFRIVAPHCYMKHYFLDEDWTAVVPVHKVWIYNQLFFVDPHSTVIACYSAIGCHRFPIQPFPRHKPLFLKLIRLAKRIEGIQDTCTVPCEVSPHAGEETIHFRSCFEILQNSKRSNDEFKLST